MTEEDRAADKRRKNAEYQRRWYARNKTKARDRSEYQRRYYAVNKTKARDKSKKRQLLKFGMTEDQYEALLTSQNFRCAICETDKPGGMGRFHVDHCHTKGHVRGLLCFHFNTGLGKFKDNPAALRQAAAYLEAAQCPSNISETSPSLVS